MSNRRVKDISAVEDSISKQVVQRLGLILSSEENERLEKRYTYRPEAYQQYRLGRLFRNEFTDKGLHRAINYFMQATQIDSNYAKAYAGMAECFVWLGLLNLAPPKETFAEAKVSASRALKIDNSIAGAHTALAFTKMFYDWDWSGAQIGFEYAITLNPNYATAHQGYSHLLSAKGEFKRAQAEIRQALEIDPTSPVINLLKGIILYQARQYDRSIKHFDEMIKVNPRFDAAHYGLALAYEQKGRLKEAIAESRRAVVLSQRNPVKLSLRAHAYAMAGSRAMAEEELNKLQRISVRQRRYISQFHIALIYTALGDSDHAFEWLEKAYEIRDPWLISMGVEPRLDDLRSDVRFSDLLRRVRLPISSPQKSSPRKR
jgi:tetratricopeptide (TPR) repeat protein